MVLIIIIHNDFLRRHPMFFLLVGTFTISSTAIILLFQSISAINFLHSSFFARFWSFTNARGLGISTKNKFLSSP